MNLWAFRRESNLQDSRLLRSRDLPCCGNIARRSREKRYKRVQFNIVAEEVHASITECEHGSARVEAVYLVTIVAIHNDRNRAHQLIVPINEITVAAA